MAELLSLNNFEGLVIPDEPRRQSASKSKKAPFANFLRLLGLQIVLACAILGYRIEPLETVLSIDEVKSPNSAVFRQRAWIFPQKRDIVRKDALLEFGGLVQFTKEVSKGLPRELLLDVIHGFRVV